MTPQLLALLADLQAFLEGYSDAIDGDDGQPAPNEAMALVTRIKLLTGELP